MSVNNIQVVLLCTRVALLFRCAEEQLVHRWSQRNGWNNVKI
jgi:hypothetical protein